ncbi:tripartite tricarboxylate transporter substrate binding protein [Ideonella sp. A 288]|uniref:Bug family tripartite tricarboxylate transporter substrate binding protein n=1 Tax=Ideonella sp. A 288 TaxID=1962181 RepID=UPI000B4C15C8|nr:tripartite tricarboxylate transporter substrate binding protein [Ideonella sp. A 288]
MHRRHWLTAAASSLAVLGAGLRAQGAYPARPVRLLVGFPPGGGIDFTARTLQPGLEAALGQPLIIEYKPGAGGVLAATELTRAAPDGHTLLVANTGPFAIAPYLQSKMPYDPLRQFSYIGQIAETGYIVATRSDHPARDLRQFVEWARAQAGKANFASAGPGSSTHLNGELLNTVAGLDLLHVPYKGSAPAVTDLIGGQTHVLIDAGTVLLPQIKGGALKALAVTGPQRDPNLPDVATVREQDLAGMEAAGFQGLVGPAGLPREVVERLAADLRKVLARPDVKARFATAGAEVQPRGPAEFAAYVKGESERWSTLIARRGIKLD